MEAAIQLSSKYSWERGHSNLIPGLNFELEHLTWDVQMMIDFKSLAFGNYPHMKISYDFVL